MTLEHGAGITRRRFLSRAAAAACAGVCAASLDCCNLESGSEDGDSTELAAPPGHLRLLHRRPMPRDDEDAVAVARGAEPGGTARAAVALLGGMAKFVRKGDRVLVKPNISWMTGRHSGATTHPGVVREICRMAIEAGASEVTVLDRTCNAAAACYSRSGIREAAEAAGARAPHASEDQSDCFEVVLPRGKALRSWSFLRAALESDVFISVPVAKHHSLTSVTLSLKNVMGILGGNRGGLHRVMDTALSDLNEAVFPDLVVLDASRVMIAHGPTGGGAGDVVERGIVVAGRNPVSVDAYAVDAAGAGLFASAPEPVASWRDVGHIREAAARGLGAADPASLRILSGKA